jgi:release factor glutamine methyltransferase
MNIATALRQGAKLLEDASISAPRLTAEVLLAHAIGCDRAWLYAHSDEELRELWRIHYGRYLHERLQGKPTQYITRSQEFYGREFAVGPDVLIPRPETEHVVEAALERVKAGLCAPEGARPCRILDIGTGSGAIAITLALETPAHVIASDLSGSALLIARQNAARLRAPVEFVQCDLGSAFGSAMFDLVVSNPPYVPASNKHKIQREVREYEPEIALYGGEDGYGVYRRLIPDAGRLLRAGGWLILEVGFETAAAVRGMLGLWSDVELRTDLAGLPRVLLARRS